LVVAFVYFLAAKLGLSMAVVAEQVSAVWPPSGIALAALLLLGTRVWPGIALGAFLANLMTHAPPLSALGIASGNTLEALAGAWFLRRFVNFDAAMSRLKDVLGLFFFSAVLATTTSATIGVASLCLANLQPWPAYAALWWVWWLGDAIGVLVMAPVILTWASGRSAPWHPWRCVEGGVVFVSLVVAMLAVFSGLFTLESTIHPLVYIIFPFVIWAALRFGQKGATVVTVAASIIAIWGTVNGLGPFVIERRNESLVLLQIFMAVVAMTGLLLGAAISERSLAEGALREADRRKDEFLAMLAHELRNPLSAIHGAVDLVRRSEPDAGLSRWSAQVIDRHVKLLARLIDDLLDVSRITRGKIRLVREHVDGSKIIDSAVEAVRPLINERGHALFVELPGVPLPLEADPMRLEQILVNLLTNAAKYTERGGKIWLSGGQEGGQIVIRVRDTGIGIAPQLLPGVFGLFTQLEGSLDRSEGGLGIGLTLVKKLAELHGGSVLAQSEGPGRGSEFVVRLPAAEPATAVLPKPERTPAAAHNRATTVLVIDDNVDSARGLERLLKLVGHKVQTAHDGPTALACARVQRPSVVLLDIGLPGMDGYQVASRLRQEEGLDQAVIIAISGYGQEADRRKSREAGFDHHLVKPIDHDALLSLIVRSD
jgi:signal transduction histidine kinase